MEFVVEVVLVITYLQYPLIQDLELAFTSDLSMMCYNSL